MDRSSLTDLADEQLAAAEASASGRSARTVRGDRALRQTLMALAAGRALDDHESPGEATLQVLAGRVRLSAGDEAREGAAGDLLDLPPHRHRLDALEASAVLLTVARSEAAAPPRPTAGSGALFAAGVACVLLGGLAAAATGPLDLYKGSWAAAYLVLVCGAASCAIAFMQARSRAGALPPTASRIQSSAWALGNAAVLAGTLAALPAIVDAGAALLLAALGIALAATRGNAPGPARTAYRIALIVLLLSVPVGVLLAHLRNGA
ncbi:cupin domain-containing protein [Glycomyces sp. A-F 0318]|nr:cupin domain-containing protein [Glycomyces amatae]MCD0442962.1 cupin domain-containing protein [Glycomyces amatae]